MSVESNDLKNLVSNNYSAGFYTNVDSESLPPGLNENTIRAISAKKEEPDWLLEWRLKAYESFQRMTEPSWADVSYSPIDLQTISFYSAPKSDEERPKSLDDVDPKIIETYEKLGIPVEEQKMLAGVAVDMVLTVFQYTPLLKKS